MSCSEATSTRYRSGARRAVAALLLLLLAGCGFHPLYADQSPLGYDPTLAAIQVRPVPDRIGQILVDTLREQLNPRGASLKTRYILTINLALNRSDLGVRRDNTSSRGELAINASLILNEAGNNTVAFKDTIRVLTAFNLSDDAYAATVAEQNAREEAAADLGREIAQRLAVYVRRQRGGAGT